MIPPTIPTNETARLKSLRELFILDTWPEDRFDLLTAYAANCFRVPVALISLVDENRQWFKSRRGLEANETPRDVSFCGHAILQDDMLVINDALNDPRFCDNPLVTSEPPIRFYAGGPLILENGNRIGTFCLIDRRPRQLTDWELGHLRDLAKVASQELQGISATEAFLRHR